MACHRPYSESSFNVYKFPILLTLQKPDANQTHFTPASLETSWLERMWGVLPSSITNGTIHIVLATACSMLHTSLMLSLDSMAQHHIFQAHSNVHDQCERSTVCLLDQGLPANHITFFKHVHAMFKRSCL